MSERRNSIKKFMQVPGILSLFAEGKTENPDNNKKNNNQMENTDLNKEHKKNRIPPKPLLLRKKPVSFVLL